MKPLRFHGTLRSTEAEQGWLLVILKWLSSFSIYIIIILFHLYDMAEMEKSIELESKSVVARHLHWPLS